TLNKEFRKFYRENNNLKHKSYVLKGNPDNIQALTDMLDKHEIKYGFSTGGKVTGYHYQSGKKGSMDAENALVISTTQPKGKMVQVLFEPTTFLSTPVTYDITAWSLPYAFGLEAVATSSLVSVGNSNSAEKVQNI